MTHSHFDIPSDGSGDASESAFFGMYIGAVTESALRARRAQRPLAWICTPVVVVLFALACTVGAEPGLAATPTTTTTLRDHASTANAKPLTAPKTTFAQDTRYFTDVTEADPALVAYEQKHRNVALQALLTDGSAFCALLKRGGGIDQALVAEAEGARRTESHTSLPLSVTTFNTIESVALLTLCPSEQKLVPTSVRAKIRNLGDALAHGAG